MNKLKITFPYKFVYIPLLCLLTGCETFLDEKPDKKLAVPVTAEHFQALLNETSQINISAPEVELLAADFYLSDDFFESLGCEDDWNLYRWQDGSFSEQCEGRNGWRLGYGSIYLSNVVLDGIQKQFGDNTTDSRYNNVRGQAYFHRAISLLEMAGIWCNAYDKNTAGNELGLPLRLNPDFNEKSVRSTLEETYQQIISDLKLAVLYLPERQSTIWWPSKTAAYGLLARTFLFMRQYDSSLFYADSCLQLNSTLLDFKNIDPGLDYSFNIGENGEIMFTKVYLSWYSLYMPEMRVSPELYRLYHSEDLRKDIFFNENSDGSYRFKGNYRGSSSQGFTGLAADEIYLIRAECLARTGNVAAAMADLNTLLEKRWDNNYVQLVAASQEQALQLILAERRKELVFRGLRWPDTKRLNKEGADISLTRTIGGQTYTLPANDPRFTILIPEDIIQISGLEQNKR